MAPCRLRERCESDVVPENTRILRVITHHMELEHACEKLQIDKTEETLPDYDYIIDRFKRSLRDSPPDPPAFWPNRFPPARSHPRSTPDSTENLLKKVCAKLEMVARDRYVMQQMARIEKCRSGVELSKLKQVKWHHYSRCPKNILNVICTIFVNESSI